MKRRRTCSRSTRSTRSGRSPSSSSARSASSRRPGDRRAARLLAGARGSRLMGEGNGRVPGVEARAGKFPGPSLIPPLTEIQREHGWLPARGARRALARLAAAAVRDRGAHLVLSALPDLAAGAARGRRLPRPLLLARARPRRAARTAPRCTRSPASGAATRRRSRSSRSAIPAVRRGEGRRPNDPYASADEHYRVLPHVRRRPGARARRLGHQGDGRRRLPHREEVGDGARPGRPGQVRDLQRGRG